MNPSDKEIPGKRQGLVKDSLNKLIPFMVRPAHHERNQQAHHERNQQAHHERNQQVTVRPVEGLNQRFLKQMLWAVGLGIALLVFALFASGILFTGAVVQSMN